MATTSKVQVKVHLSNGKSNVINLPSPINATLTDPDEGTALHPAAYEAIKAAYATDDGATVASADFAIIRTTTTDIAIGFNGN